jgi:hypothetical protein
MDVFDAKPLTSRAGRGNRCCKASVYPNGDGQPDRFTAEFYLLSEYPLKMRNLVNDPGSSDREIRGGQTGAG